MDRHKIIISTIVRDDESYLDEWIDYHTSIGFDHFVIYDHKSKNPVLPKWGKKVTVYRCPRTDPHKPNILHNYTLQEHKCEWMSLLDVDEFIVLPENKTISELLDDYKNFGGLCLNYQIYGSSGHKKRPEGNVKDNYVWCTNSWLTSNIVKSILQAQYTISVFNQHAAYTKKPIVTEDYKIWDAKTMISTPRKRGRINHYYTKSYEEWKRKVEMGNREKWQEPRKLETIHEIDKICTIKDDFLVGW